jgi:hypothetical protein
MMFHQSKRISATAVRRAACMDCGGQCIRASKPQRPSTPKQVCRFGHPQQFTLRDARSDGADHPPVGRRRRPCFGRLLIRLVSQAVGPRDTQAEEPRPVPGRAGDLARNGREAAIGLHRTILEALCASLPTSESSSRISQRHHDRMRAQSCAEQFFEGMASVEASQCDEE